MKKLNILNKAHIHCCLSIFQQNLRLMPMLIYLQRTSEASLYYSKQFSFYYSQRYNQDRKMAIPSTLDLAKYLFLDKLGEVTIQVMTFHFFCFKVLTLLLIYLYGYPSSYLLEWPVPKGLSSFWLLYSFVGIIGPWSFFYSYKRIQRTFLTSF